MKPFQTRVAACARARPRHHLPADHPDGGRGAGHLLAGAQRAQAARAHRQGGADARARLLHARLRHQELPAQRRAAQRTLRHRRPALPGHRHHRGRQGAHALRVARGPRHAGRPTAACRTPTAARSSCSATRSSSATPSVGPGGKATPQLEFRGEFLHAYLDTERVTSNKPVTLIRGARPVHGRHARLRQPERRGQPERPGARPV
jgi:hypothetical protein